MGHRDDWRSSEDAASPDDLDDLIVGVELLEEIGAGERRDRHVGRLRVGHAAEPVRAVAVDAAVALVEERALDRRSSGQRLVRSLSRAAMSSSLPTGSLFDRWRSET